jgi:nitroimidazol reductase NimA-like FMN-containing flavoprotein (pyridoxamine 5'-phosphate oxidase superfamily)
MTGMQHSTSSSTGAAGASDRPLPVDRAGIEVLSFLQCEELLEAAVIGRIAMVVAGEPVILPVNYKYVDGSVVFRTARGEKSDAAEKARPMSFEIDAWDASRHRGWSVLVKGTAHEIDSDDPVALAAGDLRPWATAVDRDIWVRIVPNEISGRRIP